MEENQEIQIHLIECLAGFKDPKNERQRLKSSHFKTLNAIYLLIRHNEKKGRQTHYPGKELISDVAKIDRSLVTEFITSKEVELFCEVKRSAFRSNEYKLKEWVYQWFRLFYRSGMMRGMQDNYNRWLLDFKKRLNRWLIPLIQSGKQIREIYESVVNKLSTINPLKVAARNPLKVAAIHASGGPMKPTGSEDIESFNPFTLPSLMDVVNFSQEMLNRFHLKEGDINSIINSFRLIDIKRGIMIRRSWENNGFKSFSPVRSMIGAIKKAIGMR